MADDGGEGFRRSVACLEEAIMVNTSASSPSTSSPPRTEPPKVEVVVEQQDQTIGGPKFRPSMATLRLGSMGNLLKAAETSKSAKKKESSSTVPSPSSTTHAPLERKFVSGRI